MSVPILAIEARHVAGLLPMGLAFDRAGRVVHVGHTLDVIAPGAVGRPLPEVVRIVRPDIPATPAGLRAEAGRRLRLELVREAGPGGAPPTALRGIAVPTADGGGLVDMSFGADPSQPLRRHGLSARHLSVTDPTVDLMFLLEAHRVLLDQFGRLNDRLDQARRLAEEEAATDKLTGLRNRRAMDLHLDRLTGMRGARFGLMHLDLDYFKSVNDTLGHAAGDRVLEEVARILREEVRRGDMVARVGGDEFTLVFEECSDVELMRRIASRIIERLETPIDWQGHACRISGSIGITMSSFYETPSAARLIADADEALYASKRAGRARHSVACPAQTEALAAP